MRCSKFPATTDARIKPLFGLLFITMLILTNVIRIYGVPFTSFQGEYLQRQQETFRELELMADLKKISFINWLNERIGDAQTHATNPLLRVQIEIINSKKQALQATAPETLWKVMTRAVEHQLLSQYFQLIKQNNPAYVTLQFVQPDGQILLSTNPTEIGEQLTESLLTWYACFDSITR